MLNIRTTTTRGREVGGGVGVEKGVERRGGGGRRSTVTSGSSIIYKKKKKKCINTLIQCSSCSY